MYSSKKIKFFAFGCWNLKGCSGNPFLNQNVKNIIKHDKFNFGLILGDNIYKDKETNEKEYSIKTLIDGIVCINKINVPMYVTLGNHDVDECKILQTQLNIHKHSILKEIQLSDIKNWIINANYYSNIIKSENNKIKLISLDSNLFEPIKVNDKLEYKYTLEDCPDEKIIVDEFTKMMELFKKDIQQNDGEDCVVIYTHVPLASIKPKKIQSVDLFVFENIINIISSVKKKVIYVCADTHNYQQVDIYKNDKFVLKQYVLGTGGAKPDSYNDSLLNASKYCNEQGFIQVHKESKAYKIKVVDGNESYGYGAFEINDKSVDFNYIKVNTLC
jgi:hypothetical protein